jgi:lathosterol oxidase
MGHKYKFFWQHHKDHHVFFNPSPFAVIADGILDQSVRSLPLLIFPLVMPTNMDVLFLTFAVFFYGYGVYLHCGHELAWPDAHHPIVNTSFQHYLHHSLSVIDRPLHTGFFVKLWDNLFGSVFDKMQPDVCLCAKCCRNRNERSREAFDNIQKPDYTVLFQPSFWLLSREK